MQEVFMQARGTRRDLELLQDMVRIRGRAAMGFLGSGAKLEKDILISKIVSVRFKKAGMWADGYIQFIFEEKASKDKIVDVGIGDDENVVTFRPGQQKEFEAIREAIEQKMTGKTGHRPGSNYDELVRLSELLNRKIITEDEFDRKKKQILGL